ncbi:MAG: hypothetical protein R2716_00940 [Microthrixaceae bacterium]
MRTPKSPTSRNSLAILIGALVGALVLGAAGIAIRVAPPTVAATEPTRPPWRRSR